MFTNQAERARPRKPDYICPECGFTMNENFPYFRMHLTWCKIFIENESEYDYTESKLKWMRKCMKDDEEVSLSSSKATKKEAKREKQNKEEKSAEHTGYEMIS